MKRIVVTKMVTGFEYDVYKINIELVKSVNILSQKITELNQNLDEIKYSLANITSELRTRK